MPVPEKNNQLTAVNSLLLSLAVSGLAILPALQVLAQPAAAPRRVENSVAGTALQATRRSQAQLLQPLREQSALKAEIAAPATQALPAATTPFKPAPVPAPNTSKPSAAPPQNAEFLQPPQIVPVQKINPFLTTLLLNGEPVSHFTQWSVSPGVSFGANRTTNFSFNGTVKLTSQIVQSLTRANVFTLDFTGSYLQLDTVRRRREITISRQDPKTLTGLQLQLSLTADCFSGGISGQQCTYTPGLVTDRSSLDPNLLVPTRIQQTANFGDVVTPASLAAMRQPGFQGGANGQQVGLDLLFPNAGAYPGNTRTNRSSIHRREALEEEPVITVSRVRQVVKANDREAVLGRTVHGSTVIFDQENLLLNSAVQLGAEWLPDVMPQLEGSTKPANTNINKNLFLAANNIRLPSGSLTIYQAGLGRALTPQKPIQNLNELPSASFNSIWVGLSPVIERRLTQRIRYVPTGPRQITSSANAEGGVDANIGFLSAVNNDIFSTAKLKNFYAQIYLGFFNQDVDLLTENQQVERTRYYPHIGFTGDITRSNSILRYYAGVLTGNTIKAYLGLDYTKNLPSGLTYNVGAIGYINPDRDYYSQIEGSLAQRITLSPTANFILSGAFNWALDQQTLIDKTIFDSQASSVRVAARANVGPVSLGLTNYFGGLLPNSIQSSLIMDVGVQLHQNFYVSAYYTLKDENASRSPYGVSAQWRLNDSHNSPTLSFAWNRNEYAYGADSFGRELQEKQSTFSVQLKFGAPPNPFAPQVVNQLQRNLDSEVDRLQRERQRESEPDAPRLRSP